MADSSVAAKFIEETDHTETWAPFSNVPTPHLISVGGEQRWFAQCGIELFAASWLFPGQEVRVETRCPDCAEAITARLKDGELLRLDPPEAVCYTGIAFDQFDAPAFIDGTYSLEYG